MCILFDNVDILQDCLFKKINKQNQYRMRKFVISFFFCLQLTQTSLRKHSKMSYTLISTDSIYSMYTITQYFVITTAYFDRLVSIYIVNKTICWFWNTIIFFKLCYAINSGVPWYILVWLWSWYRGLQKTLHRCIMVRDFEEYFLHVGAMSWENNVSQYQTQTIQFHTFFFFTWHVV